MLASGGMIAAILEGTISVRGHSNWADEIYTGMLFCLQALTGLQKLVELPNNHHRNLERS